MSTKNFVSNGDAETLFTGIGNKLSTLKSGLTNLDNEVNGDATVYPYADVITIPDAVPSNLAECSVKIEPVQDLNGYDKPWVGGAGKNKLPMTVASIKASNTSGTWSGNAYAYNGVTFTILTDNDGNVTGVSATGTASGSANFIVAASSTTGIVDLLNGKSLIYNGCPSGGSEETYSLYGYHVTTSGGSVRDTGNGVTFDGIYSGSFNFSISVASGYTIPTGGLTFLPMLRLATETDATFAPYTNICPITGHTEASVQRDGDDVWNGDSSYAIVGEGYIIPKTNISLPAGTYELYFDVSGQAKAFDFVVYKNNSEEWQNKLVSKVFDAKSHNTVNFTINEDGTNVRMYSNNPSGVTISNVRLYSTTQTYTIALGDTIYGGTVDFDSGVMTVTKAIKDLGDLTWTLQPTQDANKERLYCSDLLPAAKSVQAEVIPYAICSCYKTVTFGETFRCYTGISVSGTYVAAYDANYTDATVFTTDMTGQKICYELATPITVQLTPQQIQLLKGQNTITASTGQISVTVNGVSGAIGSVQEQVNEIAEEVNDHEERIEAVESKCTGVKITNITLDQNVSGSIEDCQVYRFGSLIVGNVRISLTGNVSGGSAILHELPAMVTTLSAFSGLAVSASNKPSIAFTIFNENNATSASLGVASGLTAEIGTYMMSFSYVAS